MQTNQIQHLNKFKPKYISRPNRLFREIITIFAIQTLVVSLIINSFTAHCAEQNKNLKNSTEDADADLIEQYIKSKGDSLIVFDSSNIKMFWTEKWVFSQDNAIKIIPEETVSTPLKIQLMNVNERQKCVIEMLTTKNTFSFAVLDNQNNIIAQSAVDEKFVNYSIVSASFNFENTTDYTFKIKFNFDTKDEISIKKIILNISESKTHHFLQPPGTIKLTTKELKGRFKVDNIVDDTSFVLKQKSILAQSTKKIYVEGNTIKTSFTIKNVGDQPTNVFCGFIPYTKDGKQIQNRNNPYKNNNKILKVISSQENSNKITVDAYPEWEKGCYIVTNAKEDLSDFPNFSFVNAEITDITKIDDNKTEITFNKVIKPIKPGTPVRVQSGLGRTFIYISIKLLAPGEEYTYSGTIKKDDSVYQFNPNSLCNGTYYIVPAISSNSVDPKEENIILIKDYTISY